MTENETVKEIIKIIHTELENSGSCPYKTVEGISILCATNEISEWFEEYQYILLKRYENTANIGRELSSPKMV